MTFKSLNLEKETEYLEVKEFVTKERTSEPGMTADEEPEAVDELDSGRKSSEDV
jgi:hypothetical protein